MPLVSASSFTSEKALRRGKSEAGTRRPSIPTLNSSSRWIETSTSPRYLRMTGNVTGLRGSRAAGRPGEGTAATVEP